MQGIEWVPLRNKCMQFKCISACSGSKSTNKLYQRSFLVWTLNTGSGGKIKWKKGALLLLCVCAKSLESCPTLCNPMDCTCWSPLSMEFSRQENWSGFPCPPTGDLFHPGTEPLSLKSPALTSRFFTASTTFALYKFVLLGCFVVFVFNMSMHYIWN